MATLGTDKKWISNIMGERDITKKMLNKLRENRYAKEREIAKQFVTEKTENDNFLTRAKILMEEATKKKNNLK